MPWSWPTNAALTAVASSRWPRRLPTSGSPIRACGAGSPERPSTPASGPALSSDEDRELVELRRRNRVLETGNEILKRAAAYFAQENVLPK